MSRPNVRAAIFLLAATILQSGCHNAPPVITGNYFSDVVEASERDLLAAHSYLATRQGNFLHLRLGRDPAASGRTKTFEDMVICEGQSDCLLYRLVEVDCGSQTAVIYQQFYEGHAAQLLDLLSGEAIDLEDVPHISPTGEYWVVADADIGYGNGLVQIVARRQTGFAVVVAEFKHSYCTFAGWRDDRTATLYCPIVADGGVNFDDIRETAFTRMSDGSWSEQETGVKVPYDRYMVP